jgi:hypothetical protein
MLKNRFKVSQVVKRIDKLANMRLAKRKLASENFGSRAVVLTKDVGWGGARARTTPPAELAGPFTRVYPKTRKK